MDTSGLEIPEDLKHLNPTAPGHSSDPAVVQEAGSVSQTLHSGPDKMKAPVVDEGLDRSAGKSVATGDARQTSGGGGSGGSSST